jgi:hypothetical protein
MRERNTERETQKKIDSEMEKERITYNEEERKKER